MMLEEEKMRRAASISRGSSVASRRSLRSGSSLARGKSLGAGVTSIASNAAVGFWGRWRRWLKAKLGFKDDEPLTAEQLQAQAMVGVQARSRRLAAPQQLQPGPLLLLDQGLAAPIAAQVAQLRTTAGFNLPLAQAKPALASHQGQPAGRDLGRPGTTAHQVGEIAYPNSLIRFQQQEPGCAPGATLGTGPFDGRRIQGPGLCPKLQGRSSGTAQGAEQLQLALRQQLGFGLEANPQAGLAALQTLHDGQLGCVGLQHADQVAVVEGWGGQRISPLDSRMAAGPRSGPA